MVSNKKTFAHCKDTSSLFPSDPLFVRFQILTVPLVVSWKGISGRWRCYHSWVLIFECTVQIFFANCSVRFFSFLFVLGLFGFFSPIFFLVAFYGFGCKGKDVNASICCSGSVGSLLQLSSWMEGYLPSAPFTGSVSSDTVLISTPVEFFAK